MPERVNTPDRIEAARVKITELLAGQVGPAHAQPLVLACFVFAPERSALLFLTLLLVLMDAVGELEGIDGVTHGATSLAPFARWSPRE